MTEQVATNDIDQCITKLLDPNLSTEQILDNIEKALADRVAILESDTATEDEKAKAKAEHDRIEEILINADRMGRAKKMQKLYQERKFKISQVRKQSRIAKRKQQKLSRKRNRK